MIPWSLRDVSQRRWRQAQAHEAEYWVQPVAGAPRGARRVKERYVGLLQELDRQGSVGKLVLEVGSGPTCVTRVLGGAYQVWVDPLAPVYRSLTAAASAEGWVAGLGEELPFRDESFDAVFSFNAIDHVISPARFVGQLVRVTRPEGRVVVGVYTHPRLFATLRTALDRAVPWLREVAHPFFLSRQSLVRLLRHHGLEVERLLCAHAPPRLPFLHRQDWVAIGRKPSG